MMQVLKWTNFIFDSLQLKLVSTDDESWKEREAAVLAIGAIAEGCFNGLYPHMSEVECFNYFLKGNIWW